MPGKDKASITLNQDPVHHGDTISFTVEATTHGNDLLALYVQCTKNGTVVYNAGGYPIGSFTLSSFAWDAAGGGAADGVATLSSFDPRDPSKNHVLASLSFAVLA